MIKKIGEKEIYRDEWLSFYQDEVEFPDGSKGTYAWVKRKNGVNIVVVTTENRILLNKEYRYVVSAYSWEIPGGGIEEGETPEEAVKRELYEETGIRVEEVEKLGTIYPLHSFNTELGTLFYTIIEPTFATTIHSEEGEQVSEQKYVSFSDALAMIDSGEINDAITAHAIQMIIRKLQKQ